MLRILGSRTNLCDGLTRREALRAGGLGGLGISLAGLSAAQAAQPERSPAGQPAGRGFGRAKRCILLYLYGSPPQHETFDPKPDAPSDVRGELNPIATSLPGVRVSELLPRTAAVLDRGVLIRSFTHPYNIHSAAYALTGVPTTDIPMELNPRDGRHWPFFGSVLDYLGRDRRREVPASVALPWKFSSRSEPFRRGGPYGGFLGTGFDPVWVEWQGRATAGDPHRGIDPALQFAVGQAAGPAVTLDRLNTRRSLLEQFDRQRRGLDAQSAAAAGFDRHQRLALDLVTSSKLPRALDVGREPLTTRERYGMTVFGQSCLAARRLIESGVQSATVFWDEFKDANSAWDTHVQQYPRLRNELCPGFDAAYPALIHDLESRGLLDETLVLVLTEHGRTPKLNNAAGGGREHWSGAYCGLMAGAGVSRGKVVGTTDRIAGFPKDSPVSPKDVLATVYHLLGVDPTTHLHDREGRPIGLVPGGRVLESVLA